MDTEPFLKRCRFISTLLKFVFPKLRFVSTSSRAVFKTIIPEEIVQVLHINMKLTISFSSRTIKWAFPSTAKLVKSLFSVKHLWTYFYISRSPIFDNHLTVHFQIICLMFSLAESVYKIFKSRTLQNSMSITPRISRTDSYQGHHSTFTYVEACRRACPIIRKFSFSHPI